MDEVTDLIKSQRVLKSALDIAERFTPHRAAHELVLLGLGKPTRLTKAEENDIWEAAHYLDLVDRTTIKEYEAKGMAPTEGPLRGRLREIATREELVKKITRNDFNAAFDAYIHEFRGRLRAYLRDIDQRLAENPSRLIARFYSLDVRKELGLDQ